MFCVPFGLCNASTSTRHCREPEAELTVKALPLWRETRRRGYVAGASEEAVLSLGRR